VSLLIPTRLSRPSDDLIFRLNREATERRAAGDAVVNATVGALLRDDGSLAVLPTASRAVHEVPAGEWAAYAPISGTPAFLRAVVDDMLGAEPALSEGAVAVATPGGTGALRLAIANFLERGQALLTTSFFWGPYATLAEEAERRVTTFPMFRENGAFDVRALDTALADAVARQGRALLFLNDPCHNPTGYSMTSAEWDQVVACVREHAVRAPVTLLVDAAYSAYAPRDPRALLARLRPLVPSAGGPRNAGLLFAWSSSKTFTHYGLRVGALVATVPPEERARVKAALSYSCGGTWANCNRGGLAAVTRLLTDGELAAACDAEREELKGLLRARVNAFNALAQPRGLRYPRYEGGFFVTVFTERAAEEAQALRREGVFVVPQEDGLRVALCSVAEKDIARLVDALARGDRVPMQ
jgi:aromatic-amino-acid transaminase